MRSFLQVESYRKGIVLSSAFNVCNKGFVFFSNLLIAYYFGTRLSVDIYFYAYSTVLLIVTFISSLNSSVIIPESMRVRMRDDPAEAMHFFNFFMYWYIVLTALACLPFILDVVHAFTAISNYNAESLRSQQAILYMSIPLIMLITLTNLLTDILASYRFFTIPALAGIINSAFSIFCVLFFHRSMGVRSITFGLLMSYTLNIVLLLVLMHHFLHWKFGYRRVRLGKRTWSNIAYAQTGNFLTTLGGYAPLYFLSGLGTGVIAALNYAQQLVSQPTNFITVQFASVARIKMSELYAKEEYENVNRVFSSSARFLVFVLLPISGILLLYAGEIITILFKRGSFDAASVRLSSDFLRYLGLSLPFTAIVSVAGNLYVSAQLIKPSIAWQIASNLLLIGSLYLAMRYFGYIGYPLAFLAINILNTLVVYPFCRIFFPFINYTGLLKYLLLLIGINALIVLALLGLKEIWHPQAAPLLAIGVVVYGIVLLGANRIFQLNRDLSLLMKQAAGKIVSQRKIKEI